MLKGNQLEIHFKNAGFKKSTKDKPKKKHQKQFQCHTCGAPMITIEGTNIMVCSNEECKQYFIFDV